MALKGLLLLSGGFDSAAAGYLAKESGAEIFAIHFSFEPIVSGEAEKKAEKLSEIIGAKKFFSVKIGKALEKIANDCEHRFYFILMKRLMLKTAEKIAIKKGFDFIITGENLGQVSSQTLSNLSAIEQAVSIPVIRPLLGFDKIEIIDFAKKIGTYEISCGPEMCDILGPKKPATRCSLEKILEEEKKLDEEKLIAELLKDFA